LNNFYDQEEEIKSIIKNLNIYTFAPKGYFDVVYNLTNDSIISALSIWPDLDSLNNLYNLNINMTEYH
jgi:hypothetical protein